MPLKHSALERIARLASLRLQERFITNATKDQYYCTDCLLNEAWSVVEHLPDSAGDRVLSEMELDALSSFRAVLAAEIDRPGAFSSSDLVHADASWVAVREAAYRCVQALGFDISGFEKGEWSDAEDA
jgi:hypothetical protein